MSRGRATLRLPRVLVIGNFLAERVGTHNVCYDLRDRLSTAGHEVVWAATAVGRLARVREMLWTAWARRAAYDVAHVDVFSGAAFRWAEAVTYLLVRLKKPLVLTLRGGALPDFAQNHPKRVARVFARAHIVTSPSAYLVEGLGPLGNGVRVVPNPVAADRYRHRVRAPLGPRMLWLRAFHEVYQPELAVRVLARVRDSYPGASLTMVGGDRDGTLADAKRLSSALGVEDAVSFAGSVRHDDVPSVLDRHEIFLNTSRVDNTPVSLIESLAAGVPVVTTNAGGIPYMIRHEETGLIAPVGDARQLADCVVRLCQDPSLYKRLAVAGRADVEQQYSWSAVLPIWQRILAEAAH